MEILKSRTERREAIDQVHDEDCAGSPAYVREMRECGGSFEEDCKTSDWEVPCPEAELRDRREMNISINGPSRIKTGHVQYVHVKGIHPREFHQCQHRSDSEASSVALVGAAEFTQRLKHESGSIGSSVQVNVKLFDAVGHVGDRHGAGVLRWVDLKYANRRK